MFGSNHTATTSSTNHIELTPQSISKGANNDYQRIYEEDIESGNIMHEEHTVDDGLVLLNQQQKDELVRLGLV
jgi:hypothetical protein